jgi:hypothetical protein
VLRLHNAQEEEGAFSLVPNGAGNAQLTPPMSDATSAGR